MAKKITPAPKGYHTVTPQLVVRNAGVALSYYVEVFGAKVLSKHMSEDGLSVLQAELKIGNSIVHVMDEMPIFGIFSPAGFGGTAVGIHLYMAEASKVWDRAVTQGAGILVPMADTAWGEHYGKFVDPFGHVWSVARQIASKAETGIEQEVADASIGISGFSVHEPLADKVDLTSEKAMTAHTEKTDNSIAA